jgi:hypothetical protein
MIQLADLNAYAAYRNRRPIPQFPQGMWRQLGAAILGLADGKHRWQREEPWEDFDSDSIAEVTEALGIVKGRHTCSCPLQRRMSSARGYWPGAA